MREMGLTVVMRKPILMFVKKIRRVNFNIMYVRICIKRELECDKRA